MNNRLEGFFYGIAGILMAMTAMTVEGSVIVSVVCCASAGVAIILARLAARIGAWF